MSKGTAILWIVAAVCAIYLFVVTVAVAIHHDLSQLPRCPNCHVVVGIFENYCGGCGYELLPHCDGCGKVCETAFCSACGTEQ
jgi:hypothetical protein